MTDPAELARQVAAQLGGDLDRILGDSPEVDAPTPAEPPARSGKNQAAAPPASPAVAPLELRQIAGRGSGLSFRLVPGVYDLGPATSPRGMPGFSDPFMTPFRLEVDEASEVTLIVLDKAVQVDGRRITTGLRMQGGVIDAHAARFEIGRPIRWAGGAPPTKAQILEALPSSKIPVTEIEGAVETKKSRRRKRSKEDPFAELTMAVLTARARTIRRQRMLNPAMGELLARAKVGRGHIWTIDRGSEDFAVAPVAYGDMSWTPPYDRPDKISNVAAHAVHQFLETPSVPITVDLKAGCFGIIGPRDAALAAVRHIAMSQAILTSPRDIEIAVVSEGERNADWLWAEKLPHRQATSSDAMPLVLVDGIAQIGARELRSVMASETQIGIIVIEDELGDLPSVCSTVMEIRRDGTAALMDFTRGSTIVRTSTPVGVPIQLVDQALADLAAAIRGPQQKPQLAKRGSADGEASESSLKRRKQDGPSKIAIPEGVKMHDNITALPQRGAAKTSE